MTARKAGGATALKYRRVLLKLSGETLSGQGADPYQAEDLLGVARQIKAMTDAGVQLGLVCGGGNLFRGLPGQACGFDRNTADNMGMLATIMNGLALQAVLEQQGVPARVMTAVDMPKIGEPLNQRRAERHLDKGRVVIFAGGTGNPFFTTDSAAALRAAEIKADALLKATKVDGVYDQDPMKHPNAKRFATISYQEALARQLKIMDAAAFALCMENRIPIIVFNFFKENELWRVLTGEPVGTVVQG